MTAIEKLKMTDMKEIISKLGKSDFLTVYCEKNKLNNVDNGAFFCSLVDDESKEKCMKDYNWDLHIGDGKPGFIFTWDEGEEISEYSRYSGLEPLVHCRDFYGVKKRYFEISEEFRLYFNLYEEYKSPTKKVYLRITDNGDEQEVAFIDDDEIKIKQKLLKEYLAARHLTLLLYFEFMRFEDESPAAIGIEEIDETTVQDDLIFNHLIRSINIGHHKTQSWIMGKKAISGLKDFKPNPFGNETKKYEEFIIGTDEDGNEIECTSNEDELSNYFGKNPGRPNYLTPVFFKKEVMQKYFNNPEKYEVKDGHIICCGLWSLRIDNNHPKHVMAYLGDLGHLEPEEQLYWKSFNISYDGGISQVAWERNFAGRFTDPDQPDLYFKMRYVDFQQKWRKKYGWDFFKPLSADDNHHFKSLHIPLSNNRKEFDEQILSLVKIIIDSLNESKLAEGVTIDKPNPKGIDKFEAYLLYHDAHSDEMMKFVRNLQSLRSTSVAHRKSDKSKDYSKIQEYFKIDEMTLVQAFSDILTKVIWILNTLEHHFLA